MRVRSRLGDDISYCTPTVAWPDSTGIRQTLDNGFWHSRNESETISDVGGKRQYITLPYGSRTLVMRNVAHEKYSAIRLNTSNSVCVTTPGWHTSQCGGYTLGVQANSSHYTDVAGYLANLCRAQAGTSTIRHYDRWSMVKPGLTTRANMAVFLYELRDLKRMFEVIPVRHLSRNWKDIFAYKMSGKSAAKYVNDLHLNYNFGWKPFLSDIVSFWKAYNSFYTRLARFISDANSDVRRSCRDPLVSVDISTEIPLIYNTWRLKYRISGSIIRSSTFQFSYVLPSYDYDEMRWRGWLDSMGLTLSIGNVWRVIPWSFVVDWFVNVSKYLDQYTSDWIQPWINFVQACSSQKVELTVDASVYLPSTGATLDVGSLRYTQYSRTVGLPNISVKTDDLDADKIRLLTSLVASRII